MMRRFLGCALAAVVGCLAHPVWAQTPVEQLQQWVEQAQASIQVDDRAGAIEFAEKIIARCRDDPGGASESSSTEIPETERFKYLLISALIDRTVGNPRRALDTSIRLLARYGEPTEANQPVRIECQIQVFEMIIGIYGSQTLDWDRLTVAMHEIQRQMIDAGVLPGVAGLTQFAKAKYAEQRGQNALLEESLDALAIVIGNEQLIADYFRVMYWNLRATLHTNRHQYFEAFEACRKFEQYALRTAPQRRQNLVAIARDQSALIAIKIGNYGEAKQKLQATIQTHTQGQELPHIRLEKLTQWRINMATAMAGSDEIEEAKQLLQDAADGLQGLQAVPQNIAAALDNNLGLIHYLGGDFQQADRLIDRAIEKATNVARAEAMVNAGWIDVGLGDIASAHQHFEQASAIFRDQLSTDHPRYAETLTYLARAAAWQGKNAEAAELIRKAEQLDYARLCRDLGSASSAEDRVAMVQQSRVHPESVAWPGAVDTYLELASDLAINERDQYEVVLRWKGLVERFEEQIRGIDGDAATRESDLHQELSVAYFDRPASSLKLRKWKARIEELASELKGIQRQRRAVRTLDPIAERTDVSTLAATLRPGDLLVDIIQIRTYRDPNPRFPVGSVQRYLAFALRPDGHVERLSLGNADELDSAITRWIDAIVTEGRAIPVRAAKATESARGLTAANRRVEGADDNGSQSPLGGEIRSVAAEVARRVQSPLLTVDARLSRLLIRPDAMTHLIPWSALPGIDGKRYWIEDLPIQICSRVPIDDELVVNHETPALLALGGVDFGPLVATYPKLAGSREERDQIVSLFREQFARGNVVGLGDSAASEAAVERNMPGKEFIHLATHAFYERRDESNVFGVTGAITALRTGVIVAAPDVAETDHDQYLTAAEIRELDLSRAALVTLSACESGRGRARAGQGVEGMLGCFHAAGVARVVGTLWVVDDAATVPIMKRFYRHLWTERRPPADALRAAQLEMIRTAERDPHAALYAHPYAWAGFFCSAK